MVEATNTDLMLLMAFLSGATKAEGNGNGRKTKALINESNALSTYAQ